MAFTDIHNSLDFCLFCKDARKTSDGLTFKYRYIPLEHRLRLMYAHRNTALKLYGYRRKYRQMKNGKFDINIDNIWAGAIMQSDKMTALFEGDDNRDRAIALQFSLDGVLTHKTGGSDIWPLICLNLNLPLSDHFKEDNILPVGVILGPGAPKDLDSFLFPFIQEAKQLSETGVARCYDAGSATYFNLKVHVVLCTGMILIFSLCYLLTKCVYTLRRHTGDCETTPHEVSNCHVLLSLLQNSRSKYTINTMVLLPDQTAYRWNTG